MMKTLCVANAPERCIQNLLDTQREFYPEQSIDLDEVFEELAEPTSWKLPRHTNAELDGYATSTFKFLVKSSISACLNSVGVKQWRDDIITDIGNIPNFNPVDDATRDRSLYYLMRTQPLAIIKRKLDIYKDKYLTLKDATTILELALWKKEMGESDSKKKRKREVHLDLRKQCRIGCRADIIIEHVLPFLMPGAK